MVILFTHGSHHELNQNNFLVHFNQRHVKLIYVMRFPRSKFAPCYVFIYNSIGHLAADRQHQSKT